MEDRGLAESFFADREFISCRWQQEVAETVFETVNQEADKSENKRKAKHKQRFDTDEKESDCILHGFIKRLGGAFASVWQTRYAKLYPNRLELHTESGSGKPELIFMDQIEEVSPDYVHFKNEQCIQIRIREGRVVLTNPVSIQRGGEGFAWSGWMFCNGGFASRTRSV